MHALPVFSPSGFRAFRGWLLISALAAILAGCSTPEDIKDTDTGTPAPRGCLSSAELSGRVSMNYTLSKNDRTESLHGKFTWKQDEKSTRISLFSPLGQTIAIIDVTPDETVLAVSGKEPLSAASAEELVFGQLGWPLPVSGMKNWLQGCATDAAGKSFIASPEKSAIVTRDGWQLRYVSWSPYGEDRTAPRRIDMDHTPPPGAFVSSIHIRLVIDEWRQ